MASMFLRSCLPSSSYARRALSTTSSARASILFQLGALSNSRETQHFNKISKLDRFEHSPNLKLIKTSEIDPYPVPLEKLLHNAPVTRADSTPAARPAFRRADNGPVWDARALAVGRAILEDTRRQRGHMARLIGKAKRREGRATRLLAGHASALLQERQRMRDEMRSAGYLIMLSVATATGFAMWTFWPAERTRDSAEVGRRIAEKAKPTIPLPPIAATGEAIAGAGAVPTTAAITGEPTVAPTIVLREESMAQISPSWSWRSLLWRQ